MTKKICLFLILILFCPLIGACKQPGTKMIERQAVENLHSDDWKLRERGIYSLQDLESHGRKPGKKLQAEIVNLLKSETRSFKNFDDKLKTEGKTTSQILGEWHKQFPPGDYDDYIKALAGYVAFNEMEDGLPPLFQLLVETDYTLTPALLTKYCSKNLKFFINKAIEGSSGERRVSVSVLSILVNPSGEIDDFDISNIPHISEADKQKIKPVFIKAAEDSDYDTRSVALYGLEAFIADPAVHQMLTKMAESDEKKMIREEARKILDRHRL